MRRVIEPKKWGSGFEPLILVYEQVLWTQKSVEAYTQCLTQLCSWNLGAAGWAKASCLRLHSILTLVHDCCFCHSVHRPLTVRVACTGLEIDEVHRPQQKDRAVQGLTKAQGTTATKNHKGSSGGSKGISVKQFPLVLFADGASQDKEHVSSSKTADNNCHQW